MINLILLEDDRHRHRIFFLVFSLKVLAQDYTKLVVASQLEKSTQLPMMAVVTNISYGVIISTGVLAPEKLAHKRRRFTKNALLTWSKGQGEKSTSTIAAFFAYLITNKLRRNVGGRLWVEGGVWCVGLCCLCLATYKVSKPPQRETK